MDTTRLVSLEWIALGAVLFAPSVAVAAPGDLFVTENEAGSVLEFSAGGDFAQADRFATGLTTPTGICVGPQGHIYVAETNAGEITIIDEGGDFTDAEPWGFGVVGIASLLCDAERIIVSCPGCTPQVVFEIHEGGQMLDHLAVLAFGMPSLSGDVVIDNERMLVAAVDVLDITVGGNVSKATPYTTGAPMLSALNLDGVLLGGEFGGNRIFDFTMGGDLSLGEPWATLPAVAAGSGVQAMLQAPGLGHLAVLGDDVYVVPDGGGDASEIAPFATGLATGLIGLQSIAAVVCLTDDECADDDKCNGDELCSGNECFPPEEPAECDDGDVCTADSCDADLGCANDVIAGCCGSDSDCSGGEFCDAASQLCVPTEVPPGDDGGDGDSSGGATGQESDDGGAGDDSGGAGSSGGDDGGAQEGDGTDGCSCRGGSPTPLATLWLVALLALRRRRDA